MTCAQYRLSDALHCGSATRRRLEAARTYTARPQRGYGRNEEAEKQRATQVANNFGAVSPGLVQNTTDLLFRDLWLRPALAPRDRSLVTVSALIANGQTAQITYHLGRAMDNGLTQEQASEVLTHIAFYAGWLEPVTDQQYNGGK